MDVSSLFYCALALVVSCPDAWPSIRLRKRASFEPESAGLFNALLYPDCRLRVDFLLNRSFVSPFFFFISCSLPSSHSFLPTIIASESLPPSPRTSGGSILVQNVFPYPLPIASDFYLWSVVTYMTTSSSVLSSSFSSLL